MSSVVSLPVDRPMGRALVVGQPALRAGPLRSMQKWGFNCTEVDEPYDAMVQLCRRPLFYSAIVLSLNSLYREELHIIDSLKRRFSHIDVWLTDTDGRQAALAEAMRLGADGLLAEDGLQRIAIQNTNATNVKMPAGDAPPVIVVNDPKSHPFHGKSEASQDSDKPELALDSSAPTNSGIDPLLTAEELRALLQEAPDPNPA